MLLYHNKLEYSRVVEMVDVTEEGLFVHDQTPPDYGGAVLQVEVVHMITLCDSSGYVEILKFDNPPPMDKDRVSMAGSAITVDGDVYRAGSSPARAWVTKKSANLSTAYRTKADITLGIMNQDKLSGLI